MNKIAIAVFFLLLAFVISEKKSDKLPIKVGILFSLSGHMADMESPVLDAVIFGIEEINNSGGLLGRKVEAIIADGKSDDKIFAAEAERLIKEEKVSAIFGCWTSSCRKALNPIVERLNSILFYPLQYEGLEESTNTIYTGSAPNQQIIPALLWGMEKFGSRIYLVGSDYIFPRAANIIINEVALAQKATVLGERYFPFASANVATVVEDIGFQKPDFILNTINGNVNKEFFKELEKAGLDVQKIPVISFSVAESQLPGLSAMEGNHYAAWSYFQSIDTKLNRDFVSAFKKRFGEDRIIDDPMESAYVGVQLWKMTVNECKAYDANSVLSKISRQSLKAPQGIVSMDRKNRHVWRTVKIGRANSDGKFDIVWKGSEEVRPTPYPEFYSRKKWLSLLNDAGLR